MNKNIYNIKTNSKMSMVSSSLLVITLDVNGKTYQLNGRNWQDKYKNMYMVSTRGFLKSKK